MATSKFIKMKIKHKYIAKEFDDYYKFKCVKCGHTGESYIYDMIGLIDKYETHHENKLGSMEDWQYQHYSNLFCDNDEILRALL